MPEHTLPVRTIIDTNTALNAYCKQLAGCQVFALDTEFLRVNTFYPKPGLFQINDGQQIILIDPIAINDWQAFSDILMDASIVKVLHACDEDVELMYHFLNVEVKNVFDTQIAAAFCGYDFCMGYQRLVAAMFDVDIEKGESRSDWMRRPLSQSQLSYAANDVVFLLDMYEQLSKILLENGHLSKVYEECDGVFYSVSNDDFSAAYKRFKQAWKLNAEQFSRLKVLASWREEQMRERNLPRNKIAKNEVLMRLALKPIRDQESLAQMQGLPLSTVKVSAQSIMQIVNADYSSKKEVMARPLKSDTTLAAIKNKALEIAQQQGIAEQMLSRKAYNESVARLIKSGDKVSPSSLDDVIEDWRKPYYLQLLNDIQQVTL